MMIIDWSDIILLCKGRANQYLNKIFKKYSMYSSIASILISEYFKSKKEICSLLYLKTGTNPNFLI